MTLLPQACSVNLAMDLSCSSMAQPPPPNPCPELSQRPLCFHKHHCDLLQSPRPSPMGGQRQLPSAPPRWGLRIVDAFQGPPALDETLSLPGRPTGHSTASRWEGKTLGAKLWATASTQLRPCPQGMGATGTKGHCVWEREGAWGRMHWAVSSSHGAGLGQLSSGQKRNFRQGAGRPPYRTGDPR